MYCIVQRDAVLRVGVKRGAVRLDVCAFRKLNVVFSTQVAEADVSLARMEAGVEGRGGGGGSWL